MRLALLLLLACGAPERPAPLQEDTDLVCVPRWYYERMHDANSEMAARLAECCE